MIFLYGAARLIKYENNDLGSVSYFVCGEFCTCFGMIPDLEFDTFFRYQPGFVIAPFLGF